MAEAIFDLIGVTMITRTPSSATRSFLTRAIGLSLPLALRQAIWRAKSDAPWDDLHIQVIHSIVVCEDHRHGRGAGFTFRHAAPACAGPSGGLQEPSGDRGCIELRRRVLHVKRTQSIEIARSPDEVFAYLTDPSKLSTWQDAEEVAQLTPGPLGTGTRLREVHKALGRRRVEITEIVVYAPGRRFEIRVVDGPPVDGRWDFEPSAAGTRLTFTPIVRPTGFWRRFESVVVLATLVLFRHYHRRLKRALEAG